MEFGIMFFSSSDYHQDAPKAYDFLIEATKFADKYGFCCVWTPERHFHEFGGMYPNPSVLSAALATITTRIQIRAGSLISPLHNVIRIAEEWSVVDNLSNGRIAISFGSGWNINDFVFFPERYESRRDIMYQQIGTIQKLWRGEDIHVKNSLNRDLSVRIFPRPVQSTLPIWVTSSGNVDTFIKAGSIGANVLTHLIGQDIPALTAKIQRYRQSLADGGYDSNTGKVSLMLHTFLGTSVDAVQKIVREPFRNYLRSAISLEKEAAQGGGVISGSQRLTNEKIPEDLMEDLLDITFERYFSNNALMGTPSTCQKLVRILSDIGVDEIACLIDFGPDYGDVMVSLEHLVALNSSREDLAN